MKIHKSGLITIQLKSFNDDAILNNIKLLLQNNTFPLSCVLIVTSFYVFFEFKFF